MGEATCLRGDSGMLLTSFWNVPGVAITWRAFKIWLLALWRYTPALPCQCSEAPQRTKPAQLRATPCYSHVLPIILLVPLCASGPDYTFSPTHSEGRRWSPGFQNLSESEMSWSSMSRQTQFAPTGPLSRHTQAGRTTRYSRVAL